jgi:hypothetical protein
VQADEAATACPQHSSRLPSQPPEPEEEPDADVPDKSQGPLQHSEEGPQLGPKRLPMLRLTLPPESTRRQDDDEEMSSPREESDGEEGGPKRKRTKSTSPVRHPSPKRTKGGGTKPRQSKGKQGSSGLLPVRRPKEITVVPFAETKATELKDLTAHYVCVLAHMLVLG